MAAAGALNRPEEAVDPPPPCRAPAATAAIGGRVEVFFAGTPPLSVPAMVVSASARAPMPAVSCTDAVCARCAAQWGVRLQLAAHRGWQLV